MAVRDDGLAYFTEAFNAGVGIASTKTKTLDGFIPTGSARTFQSGAITATMPLSGDGFGVGVTVGGEPRRLGFSQRGAIANMAGFVTFVR